tara:strand:+ start:882 stop:1007 length:126 start_codon:yes stop_codon:yes gene_type:complete
MTAAERIKVMEKFNKSLAEKTEEIADLIQWEICKTKVRLPQ